MDILLLSLMFLFCHRPSIDIYGLYMYLYTQLHLDNSFAMRCIRKTSENEEQTGIQYIWSNRSCLRFSSLFISRLSFRQFSFSLLLLLLLLRLRLELEELLLPLPFLLLLHLFLLT